jgi:tetratricopeptide (TPR) repeat protein
MRGWALLAAVGLLGGALYAKTNPSATAAEFYYRQYDFRQALPLWQDVLLRDPENTQARMRVAEMSLWTEGRGTLAERMRPALDAKSKISPENKALLKRKFWELQTVFLTDQAQNLFYQGKHRAERGDTRGAWDVLNQAAALDRGQFLILRERARLEKSLGEYAPYYETLRQAAKSYPYDSSTVTDLAEAHLHAKNPGAALEALQALENSLDFTQTVLYAVALADSGAGASVLSTLRTLANGRASKSSLPPIVYYSLAHVLASMPGSEAESKKWLEQFLQAVPAASVTATTWDPFHLQERIADARRSLAR